MEKYKQQFQVGCQVTLTFDASPLYFGMGNQKGLKQVSPPFWTGWARTGPQAVRDVRSALGNDLKIVFVVRDPVDWLNSMRYTRDGRKTREGWDLEPISCFADSLQTWIDVFGKEQFFFLESSSFLKNQKETMDRVFAWLNAPPYEITPSSSGRRRSKHKASMKDRKAYHMNSEHRACRERLEKLTGLSFTW